MKQMSQRTMWFGIVTCGIYFISVMCFMITKTESALTFWEIMSILGAPAILLVLLELTEKLEISRNYRSLMLVFMSCTCALTGLAHFLNIVVTRRLMADGVNVPTYFQIGYWPSTEMAADYLAWGFFMGLAFLACGIGITKRERGFFSFRIVFLICAVLCLGGFAGSAWINENIWYMAPMAYGFGTVILCVMGLRFKK